MKDAITNPTKNQYFWIITFFISSTLIGGIVSIYLGQDANWDIQNYHLYNGWAYSNDRLALDLNAAGIQSYFNPLLDILYYYLSFKWFPESPRAVAFIMGLPYGISIFLSGLLAWISLRHLKSFRGFAVAAASIIGITGSASVSQIGTTFNEIQISIFILAALIIICWELSRYPTDIATNKFVIAGLLAGVAAGLKLTAGIYAPAIVISILISNGFNRKGVVICLYFSIGWSVGFSALFIWWGWKIYNLTGNPVFPMFNDIFKSEWYPKEPVFDNRFKPKSISQILFYPFYWTRPNSMTVTEVRFSDARFAIAYLSLLLLPIATLGTKILHSGAHTIKYRASIYRPEIIFLIFFVLIAYVLWQYLFSILRYTIPIESILGIIIVFGIYSFLKTFIVKELSKAAFFLILFCLTVYLAITTNYPKWGRIQYLNSTYKTYEAPIIPDGSLLVLSGKPSAYVLPVLGITNNVSAIGIEDAIEGYDLWNKLHEKILNHNSGPIFVLELMNSNHRRSSLQKLGLNINDRDCTKFSTNLGPILNFCGPIHLN